MVTEDYVSFETAKLLKKKGFETYSFSCFNVFKGYTYEIQGENITADDNVTIPTLQMAMKWLREVYGICIELLFHPNKEDWGWYFQILVIDNIKKCFCGYGPYKTYSSYEKTCEAAIKYCLENLI